MYSQATIFLTGASETCLPVELKKGFLYCTLGLSQETNIIYSIKAVPDITEKFTKAHIFNNVRCGNLLK